MGFDFKRKRIENAPESEDKVLLSIIMEDGSLSIQIRNIVVEAMATVPQNAESMKSALRDLADEGIDELIEEYRKVKAKERVI